MGLVSRRLDWRINMWGHSPCWPLNLHWTDQSASLQRIQNMHHLSTLTIKAKSLPTSLDVLVFCFVNGDPMCCFQLHVNINNNIIGTNISFYGIITFILFNQALLWGLALCQWAVQSFTRFQHSADCWFQEYESDRFASQGKALEYLTFWEEEEGSELKRQVMPNRLGFSISLEVFEEEQILADAGVTKTQIRGVGEKHTSLYSMCITCKICKIRSESVFLS